MEAGGFLPLTPPHIDQRGLSQAFSSPVTPGIPLCLGLDLRGHFFRQPIRECETRGVL